jgi:hypothetical protein
VTDPWAGKVVDAATRAQLLAEAAGEGPELGRLLERYYPWQAERWPWLQRSLAAMEAIRSRAVGVGARPVQLQWNPGRERSATAKVSDEEVKQRPCFLCAHNLPPEEVGLATGEQLVWLANPMPVVPLHFTVVHREHREQEIRPVLTEAIGLARAVSGRLSVFYNGPRSGASAPDHLHLQGVAAATLPDERWVAARLAAGEAPGRLLHDGPGLRTFIDRDAQRALLTFHGEPEAVEAGLRAALQIREQLGGYDGWEPPLNLLLSSPDGERVTALLYPRGAHRPSCFFAEGPARRVVSPGAVDVAGLVITPRRSDYEVLDGASLRGIFAETAIAPELADELEGALMRRLSDG